MISVVTPAFNESANLATVHEELARVLDGLGEDWEWIVVDDHSRDTTFAALSALADADPRVRGLRLSRNFGSHAAVQCGLQNASGEAVVVIAGDGQDPADTLAEMISRWRAGAQVVWAARADRKEQSRGQRLFSNLYYWLMRRVVGIADMPENGADFFLIDRVVRDGLLSCRERNMSVFALICWMGFRQEGVTYTRRERLSGSSGWTLRKRVKLVIDSVVSFSYFPIRMMALLGVVCGLSGLLYVPVIVFNAIFGHPTAGWSELMTVILLIGGLQMVMLAVLGEYLWRALEEARGRPAFLVEAATVPQTTSRPVSVVQPTSTAP